MLWPCVEWHSPSHYTVTTRPVFSQFSRFILSPREELRNKVRVKPVPPFEQQKQGSQYLRIWREATEVTETVDERKFIERRSHNVDPSVCPDTD